MTLNKLSDNLNLLMTAARISASQLARRINVPLSSIKKIRKGDNKNPTLATLLPIAEFFSVTLEDLVAGNPLQKINNLVPAQLPLISWQEALNWSDVVSNKRSVVFSENDYSEHAYTLFLEADCGIFLSNSLLLIEPNIYPLHGDYVVVHKEGLSLAVLKQFLIEEEKPYLKSLNITTHTVLMAENYRLLGVVMEYHHTLKKMQLIKTSQPILKKQKSDLVMNILETIEHH